MKSIEEIKKIITVLDIWDHLSFESLQRLTDIPEEKLILLVGIMVQNNEIISKNNEVKIYKNIKEIINEW